MNTINQQEGKLRPGYGADHHLVDYILGITHEIWEGGGMELILDYYHPEVSVYALEGVTHGAQAMTDGSKAVLAAFPDRMLFGEAVIWSEEAGGDRLSSHRIFSPMTNLGESKFGPATGARVELMIIADCLVRDGRIVEEWLVRDNLALVRQLGLDPVEAARQVGQSTDARSLEWRSSELARLAEVPQGFAQGTSEAEAIAGRLLSGLWQSEMGDMARSVEACYAPYAVLHRSPVEYYSGRPAVLGHYQDACRAFGNRRVSLDHLAARPFDDQGMDLAVRWTMRCTHSGDYLGQPATGKSLLILGISHWRLFGGRVLREWTLFDGLAVLAQIID